MLNPKVIAVLPIVYDYGLVIVVVTEIVPGEGMLLQVFEGISTKVVEVKSETDIDDKVAKVPVAEEL